MKLYFGDININNYIINSQVVVVDKIPAQVGTLDFCEEQKKWIQYRPLYMSALKMH